MQSRSVNVALGLKTSSIGKVKFTFLMHSTGMLTFDCNCNTADKKRVAYCFSVNEIINNAIKRLI